MAVPHMDMQAVDFILVYHDPNVIPMKNKPFYAQNILFQTLFLQTRNTLTLVWLANCMFTQTITGHIDPKYAQLSEQPNIFR